MAGHGSKFGGKMEAAIAALLSQRNQEEAAKTAGVSKRTLNRWLKMPAFQSAYQPIHRWLRRNDSDCNIRNPHQRHMQVRRRGHGCELWV